MTEANATSFVLITLRVNFFPDLQAILPSFSKYELVAC